MRNRIGGALLALIIGGTATMYGCNSDGIAGPESPPAATAPARPNAEVFGATPTTTQQIVGEEVNLCNEGELVPYRGNVSFGMFATTGLTTHNRVRFSYVFDGTGSLDNVYHGASEYEEEMNTNLNGSAQTFNHEVRMTSRTAPDMRIHIVAHVNLTADGGVAAAFGKGEPFDCQK